MNELLSFVRQQIFIQGFLDHGTLEIHSWSSLSTYRTGEHKLLWAALLIAIKTMTECPYILVTQLVYCLQFSGCHAMLPWDSLQDRATIKTVLALTVGSTTATGIKVQTASVSADLFAGLITCLASKIAGRKKTSLKWQIFCSWSFSIVLNPFGSL